MLGGSAIYTCLLPSENDSEAETESSSDSAEERRPLLSSSESLDSCGSEDGCELEPEPILLDIPKPEPLEDVVESPRDERDVVVSGIESFVTE
uniref:Uncharacterized protein n=1 Tax=Steinernema glaseri TaxID=37863 RepID=A0A1I7ZFK8_9BILA